MERSTDSTDCTLSGRAPVTVVIPCFKDADTIHRAVSSALEQTWPPSEVLIVDDASADKATSIVLQEIQSESSGVVRVIFLKDNCGPSVARNRGWQEASQPYIAFLDADDAWHPRKLELQMPIMMANGAPAISGHQRVIAGDSSEGVLRTPPGKRWFDISTKQLLFRNWLPTSSVIVNASVAYRFNDERRHCEDYDLWLRIVTSGSRCSYIPIGLAAAFKAPFGEKGLGSQLSKMEVAQNSVYRELRSNSAISRSVYLMLRVWSAIRFARRITVATARRVLNHNYSRANNVSQT